MTTKYWIQYRYQDEGLWEVISEFVTVGEGCEFKDLESWWVEESSYSAPHEIVQIVKL